MVELLRSDDPVTSRKREPPADHLQLRLVSENLVGESATVGVVAPATLLYRRCSRNVSSHAYALCCKISAARLCCGGSRTPVVEIHAAVEVLPAVSLDALCRWESASHGAHAEGTFVGYVRRQTLMRWQMWLLRSEWKYTVAPLCSASQVGPRIVPTWNA